MAEKGFVQWSFGDSKGDIVSRRLATYGASKVEFDDYIGPGIVTGKRIVPIVPETVLFDPRSNKTGSIRQLPLVLGWAIAIHKSQGLTLKVVDVGDRERQSGLTYVGCSRVRSASNLAFAMSFPFERMRRLNDSPRFKIVFMNS